MVSTYFFECKNNVISLSAWVISVHKIFSCGWLDTFMCSKSKPMYGSMSVHCLSTISFYFKLSYLLFNSKCFLCNLSKRSYWFIAGGQLVFDWDRLEHFLITRDQPVGDKVTSTKCHKMQWKGISSVLSIQCKITRNQPAETRQDIAFVRQ